MSGTSPPTRNSSIRSWNWPWMSPHIWSRSQQEAERWRIMRKATHRYRRRDRHHVALFNQKLAGPMAEFSHLRLGDGTACAQLCDGPAQPRSAAWTRGRRRRRAGEDATCRDRSCWARVDDGDRGAATACTKVGVKTGFHNMLRARSILLRAVSPTRREADGDLSDKTKQCWMRVCV